MDAETVMRKAMDAGTGGKAFPLPEVDPWAPKRHAPELKNIKRVPALPAADPAEPQRDFLHVASDDMRTFDDKRITLSSIIVAVAVATQVLPNEIRSPRRLRYIVAARHVYFWIARNYTSRSFPEIGRFCSRMDHTTVMHGVKKVDANMPEYAAAIARAVAILNSGKCG